MSSSVTVLMTKLALFLFFFNSRQVTRMRHSDSFGDMSFIGGEEEAHDAWHHKWVSMETLTHTHTFVTYIDKRVPSLRPFFFSRNYEGHSI